MGFDNECILNIQSLPGEYFCPVCRTLVYPSEALQTQCTHLYCKPCLAYIVATTRACPYDGYLVTEADSKPLLDSNKAVVDGISNIQVHCLYHRSGCQWQGSFSDCITHCADCSFGNSPVVCNRCGTQIVHRQVQEHAQICPGVQPLTQQADASQTQTSAQQSTTFSQASQDSSTQTTVVSSTVAASAVQVLPASNVASVAVPASSATTGAGQAINHGGTAQVAQTPEQWYQQQQLQYQQYYQQYPGYDPYQQQYQQQIYSQPPAQSQPAQIIQGQHPQPYVYPQPQAFPMPQAHVPPQAQQMHPHPPAQPQTQLQAQTQTQVQGQVPQIQAPLNPPQQPQVPPVQVQSHQAPYGQIPAQQMGNPPTQPFYPPMQQPQQQPILHSHQQQPAALQHLPSQPLLQQQPHVLQSHAQPHLQQQPHQPLQQQPLTLSQQHPVQSQQPSAPSVSGYQYHAQHQPHQQMFTGAPSQYPVPTPHQGLPNQSQHNFQVQKQLPPQQSQQVRPLQPNVPMRTPQTGMQQQPYVVPPSNQHPIQQQIHHYPGPQHPQQQGVPSPQVYGQMHQQQSSRPPGPMHMHQSPAHAQVGVPTRPSTGNTMTMHQALPYAQSASSGHVPHHGASAASMHSSHVNGPPQISSGRQVSIQPSGSQGTTVPLAEGAIMTSKINDSIMVKMSGPADSQDATTSGNLKFRETTDSRSAPKLYPEFAGVKIKPGDSEEKGGTEAESNDPADQGKDHKVKEDSGEKTIEQSPSEEALESVVVKQTKLNKPNPFAPEVEELKRSNDKILSGTLSHGQDKSIPPAEMQAKVSGSFSQPLSNSNAPNNTDPQRTHPEMMLPQYNPYRGLNPEGTYADPMSSRQQPQGHLLAPNLMRPLAQGKTPVVPDPFQPPSGHPQPQGLFRPDSYGAFPGQGFPSFGSGLPQGETLPVHLGNKMPGPTFQGPPSSLDASAGMGRQPPSLDGQTGHHRLPAPEPDFYGSTQGIHEPSKLNGLSNNPLEPFGSGDGRFRALHDDRLRSFPVDSTRGAVDRRQFEDDLKQFPRQGNIDGEIKFEKYLSEPRHGMGSHMLGFDHGSRFKSNMDSGPIASRELPGYPLDVDLRGSESGSYFHSMDTGNRQRLHGLSDDHASRKNESHLRFHGMGPDFGPHRPFRSPGRDFAGIPTSRYGFGAHSGFEDYLERSGFDERRRLFNHPSESGISNLPPTMTSHFFRNDHMRPGANSVFLPNHLRNSDLLGSRMHNLGPGVGGHIRMGDFPSNLRNMESGNMSFGEPEVSMYGENFELARKKKFGTMGWCRICKIDCETVEGLDLHSQTMEHQKMAMDIVLSIKRESGKKQKLSVETNASVDEANKMKKNGAETRMNKH